MKRLHVPTDERGWETMASSIIKANLTLAGMTYLDLEHSLREMGIDQGRKTIGSKLCRGGFSAAFFMQVLVAAGVERLELPTRGEGAV